MWNNPPKDGTRTQGTRLNLRDSIVNAARLVLSLGLGLVILAGGLLYPLLWDESEGKAALAKPSLLRDPIYEIKTTLDEPSMLLRTRRDVLIRCRHTGELIGKLPEQSASPSAVTWIPGSGRFLVGYSDGRLILWERDQPSEMVFTSRVHQDSIREVATTKDGTIAATASADQICLWDLQQGRLLAQTHLSDAKVVTLELSPDERQFLAGCDNGRLQFYSSKDLQLSQSLHPDFRCASHVKFLKDGHVILVGNLDGTFFTVDRNTGKTVRLSFPCRLQLVSMEVSPEGQFVAYSDWFNQIHIYSLKTQKKMTSLEGHPKAVTALRFSESEPLLYSASYDGTVRIWDMESFAEIGSYQGSPPLEDSPSSDEPSLWVTIKAK